MSGEQKLLVCQELDQTWIEYLNLLETYQQQRKRTNFLINNGFMELAHSKYIMGPNKITQYQYDRRMQANTRVEWNSDALIEIDTDSSTSLTSNMPGRWVMTTNVLEAPKGSVSSSASKNPVRQRSTRPNAQTADSFVNSSFDEGFKGHGPSFQNDTSIPLTEFVSPTESSALQAKKDPINWFGVLAPAQLKNSQASFQQAVLELTTSANLIQQISSVESRLIELQKRK